MLGMQGLRDFTAATVRMFSMITVMKGTAL